MNKIQNQHTQNGLVVVSAKEHGKIYLLKDGELSLLEYVAEHSPTYSDNEGFFFRSGNGRHYGSGNPRETDDEYNLNEYIKAITTELSAVVNEHAPDTIFVIEPEHLKGLIASNLQKPNNLVVSSVAFVNVVEEPIERIMSLLEAYNNDTIDPADPASVTGEENSEEKRKILETGQMLDRG